MRAIAITAVVLGHWLATAVTGTSGALEGRNVLAVLDWTHALTWLFQVMPLFFFVGGYANAASLESHGRAGGDRLGWAVGRYNRLVKPTSVLLAVLAAVVVAARLGGVDVALIGTVTWVATLPLWFVAAYLAVLGLSPLAFAAHRRWGLAVPAVLLVGVLGGDVARLALGTPWVAAPNFLLGWLIIHQMGFAWRDGRLPARPGVGIPIAVASLVTLALLTLAGPYPVSMVRVPGADFHNTAPPSLALLALAGAQVGVTVAVRDHASGWLRRRRVWVGVMGVNAVIMTVFLWHMAAAIVAALLLYGTGLLPLVPLGSAEWLVWRIPWVGACAVVLGVLVAVFASVELRVPGSRKGATADGLLASAALLAGMGLTLAGMLGIAFAGPDGTGLALPPSALLAYAIGAGLLAWRG